MNFCDQPIVDARSGSVIADPERLRGVRASGLLEPGGGARDALTRIARIAARTLRAPLAQVNIITDTAQVPVACAAEREPERWLVPSPLDACYCQYVVTTGAPMLVADARVDPRVATHPATLEAGVVAYAGVPLRAPAERGGHALGSVCVVDFEVRAWTGEELELLEELSALATEQVHWIDEVGAALDSAKSRAAESEYRAAEIDRALDRRLAELEAVYAHAGVGLCVLDRDLRWVRINERLAEMNGFPPESHLGRRIDELLPAVAEEVAPKLRGILEGAVSELELEVTAETPARPGEPRIWREHFVALRDAGGEVVGINVVCEEVTERRRIEAERVRLLESERRARAEAERANRAKSEFLATMSHELRTPLNAIGGYVQLIEMELHGPVTQAQRDSLGRVRQSQAHLLGLINEVLDYARIEAGAVRYEARDVPLRDALAAAVALVVPEARAKAITLAVAECAPGLAARADPDKLRQILLNLLSNSTKFTPRGGAVRLECDAEGSRVLVRVRDSGIGIAHEKQERIFDAFVQAESGHTRAYGGSGLGLAISRDFARGMGGDLTVESQLGVGSLFTLTLPRGRRSAE